jgi:hypothetical protein
VRAVLVGRSRRGKEGSCWVKALWLG